LKFNLFRRFTMQDLNLETLKGAVRALRNGNEGVTIGGSPASLVDTKDGVFLDVDGRRWRVEGTERLRLSEQQPPKVTEEKARRRASGEPAQDSEGVCATCGKAFVKSKFNPYFTECPDCRKAKSLESKGKMPPSSRDFTCSECRTPFTVSKFQPYLFSEPGAVPVCKKCVRKAAHKAYMSARRDAAAPEANS
jgi:hypothetical protein